MTGGGLKPLRWRHSQHDTHYSYVNGFKRGRFQAPDASYTTNAGTQDGLEKVESEEEVEHCLKQRFCVTTGRPGATKQMFCRL